MAPLTEHQRYLLAACVDKYLPLDEAGRAEFEQFVNADQEVRAMTKGFIERAYDEGVEAGEFRLAVRTLEKRFGPLPAEARDRLRRHSSDELCDLTLRIGTAASLGELGLSGEAVASA